MRRSRTLFLIFSATLALAPTARAATSTSAPASGDSPANAAPQDFGFHSYLDSQPNPNSHYGRYWFPEPIRAEEGDVDRELRLDFFHTEKRNLVANDITGEVAWNFNLLTVELAGQYHTERDVLPAPPETIDTQSGWENFSAEIRHPLFGYTSQDGNFDYTFVPALELGIPSGGQLSEDFEFVPGIRQLLALYDHASIQTSVAYSQHIGPEEGGESHLEYSAAFGYTLYHDELPVPDVLSTTPLFEIKGEWGLSKEDVGKNEIEATVGLRVNLESIGPGQPRLGVGYTFPLDQGAKQNFDWGITLSLIYEF